MIKIKMIYAEQTFFDGLNFNELSEFVNELGKDRILHITASERQSDSGIKYTIFYEDGD